MIEIPLIPQDIRPDEVTIRALKTFEFLDKAVDQIFDRIDARITKNMTRIDNINARLEKANEKIDKLKKSKKAIRMYSSARYPIENPPKIEPTFEKNFTIGEINFNYKLDLPLYENTEYKQFGDKLAFFHLKRSRKPISHKPNIVFKTSSINSLITFVNNENLYLKDHAKAREKEVLVEQVTDDANDFSKFSTMMRNKQQDNLHYLPTFHQAPEFEFPLDLPDLDGIAGDISFSVPDSELIAPALWSMNIVNDLPNFNELLEAETKKSQKSTVEIENVPLPPSIPKNIPLAPVNIPPPPPIPKNLTIPAPPPPPAIPIDIKAMVVPASPVDDSRSSLMKAIRDAAGKAKLKKSMPAAADEPDFSKKKQPQQKEPAKDLMSDLHEKLMLRRKGIAGSKEAKKEKSSIMSKVSSLIPPPPKKTESDSDSTSNNDEEDWN